MPKKIIKLKCPYEVPAEGLVCVQVLKVLPPQKGEDGKYHECSEPAGRLYFLDGKPISSFSYESRLEGSNRRGEV